MVLGWIWTAACTTLASVLQTASTRMPGSLDAVRAWRRTPGSPTSHASIHIAHGWKPKARLPGHYGILASPSLCLPDGSERDAARAPAGAEATTQPSDANATPPAPPQPFGELLETIEASAGPDPADGILSKMAIFQLICSCRCLRNKGRHGSA